MKMRRAVLGCIVFCLNIRNIFCQCNGTSIDVTGGTRAIKSPGYPDQWTNKSCSWNFHLPNRKSKILIMNFTDIQLCFADSQRHNSERCLQTLTVETYSITKGLLDTTSLCRVYYTDNACHSETSEKRDIDSCIDRGNLGNPISVVFTSKERSGIGESGRNTPGGFKMEYKYLNCPSETTETATRNTATEPQTSSTFMKILESTSKGASPTTSVIGSDVESNQQNGIDPIVPILAVLGVVIVLIVLGALIYVKRKKSKMQTSTQANAYQEMAAGQSTDAVYSVAYDNSAERSVRNEPGVIQSGSPSEDINQSQTEAYSVISLTQPANQSTLHNHSVGQSENAEYSTLDLGQQTLNQLGSLSEDINQSQTEAYSTINLTQPANESSLHNHSVSQSENAEYSTLDSGQQTLNQSEGEYSTLKLE